jgi:hypothetical protein
MARCAFARRNEIGFYTRGSGMSGIFFSAPLAKTSSNGPAWAHIDAYFPRLQVFATATLSAYRTQTPQQFTGFQPSWAEAWIVTPETPTTVIAGIPIPSRRDNTVYLATDRLTFWLQVSNNSSSNPPVSASAVGVVYEYAAAPRLELASAVESLELAAYTEDGTVVSTHRSLRLEGGPPFDKEEARERFLAEAHALANAPQGSLNLATLQEGEMPTQRDFRVDVATGKAVMHEDDSTGSNSP